MHTTRQKSKGETEIIMSMYCDVFVQWTATPEQLSSIGAAFWRWCSRKSGKGLYQNLDNQALADLIAGRLPASSLRPHQAGRRGVHFWVRDEGSHDRQATIARLRRMIPHEGVEDIVVDGRSWNLIN